MKVAINGAAELRMIEDHLTSALELAERSGETLIAALVCEAVSAVVDRYKELRSTIDD